MAIVNDSSLLVWRDQSQSAVNVKDLLHEWLNADRVDLKQDERMFLVEIAHVGEFVQQSREHTASG